jgi:hypothetical protein
MTMSSSYTRPFGAPSYPDSPSAATASSVNYSQYGGSAFSPSRQPQPLSGFGQTSGRLNAATSGSGRPGGSGGKNSAGKTAESREIARVHFKALKGYLMQWLDKGAYKESIVDGANGRNTDLESIGQGEAYSIDEIAISRIIDRRLR